MEVEAESVAYVLGRHYGVETIGAQSFEYIDVWAAGDKKKVQSTAQAVVDGVRAFFACTGIRQRRDHAA